MNYKEELKRYRRALLELLQMAPAPGDCWRGLRDADILEIAERLGIDLDPSPEEEAEMLSKPLFPNVDISLEGIN